MIDNWIAVALLPVLLGAAWAHAGNGWLFTAPNGALLGDGRFAISSLFNARKLQGAYA